VAPARAAFVTIEAQEESVRLARKSAAYNGLEERYEIRHGDFRQGSCWAPRSASIWCSAARRTSRPGAASKATIRRRWRAGSSCAGDIRDYCAVAAAHSRAGGLFACVFPEEQRERVESAARERGLDVVRRRPVVFKEGEPPLVTLFAMVRRGRSARSGCALRHGSNPRWSFGPPTAACTRSTPR
jgi:tRNA1(Val) A37 N6-methylase TrmN6